MKLKCIECLLTKGPLRNAITILNGQAICEVHLRAILRRHAQIAKQVEEEKKKKEELEKKKKEEEKAVKQ